jgi:hypothetical protein
MKMKWTIAVVSALAVMLGASSSMAQGFTVEFGSDNDGLGGFTATTFSTNQAITETAGAVNNYNGDPGTVNSSFLRTIGIDRTPGSTTTMSGTFTWRDGYADDNNRIALYLFGADDNIVNEDELAAISLVWNYDSPSGTGPDDEITFQAGIDAGALSIDQKRDTTSYNPPTQMFDTEITLGVEISFFDDGGTNKFNIIGSLTDDQGNVTLVTNTTPFLASEHLGNNFGFATRGRARNILIGGSRSEPQVFDYESFTVIPEPGTLSLFALMGGGIMFIRRRFGK